MLKEIFCDRFINNGKIREPILFHEGLNTILGSETGSNSIGKSTFLMILDYAFGGMDYIEKSTDVHKNVGPHRICFLFEFDGEGYYFARSTVFTREVEICDKEYNVQETITLDRYNNFLKLKYGMGNLEMSFRAAVGKFFRVYLRECCDEGHPLRSANRVPDKAGITELIQLYNKYKAIAALMEVKKDSEERYTAYRKAIKYSQISAPANQKEYKKNVQEIQSLVTELRNLSSKSNAGLLDVDSVKAKTLADMKGSLSKLYRQRSRLKAKMKSLGEESFSVPIEKDFTELLKYFPTADTVSLAEIEEFHAGVTSALKAEYGKRCRELDSLLSVCEEEIVNLEKRIKSVNSVPNVSQAILDSYADIKQRHDKLIEANKHFDEEKSLRLNVSDLKAQISSLISSELLKIESEINSRMKALNMYVFETPKSSPVLDLKDESHYSFETPNDSGTGSRYKGLILFDLSVLETTPLPVIAHDSFMLKQIEDHVLEKLFELYSDTKKQVFIAIDKQGSYTKHAEELLERTEVLRLSPGGNELFGRSWNVLHEDA